MTEPTFEPTPEETPMSGPGRPDAAPRSEPMPEHTPEEAPMSEPDATAPQAGGGKDAADEESALRWQAADELLTALAVSPTAHRNLVEVRRAFERAEALGVLSSFSETSDDEEGSEDEADGQAGFAEPRPDRPPQQESVSGVLPATGLRGGRVGFAHWGLLGGVLGRGLAPRSRIGPPRSGHRGLLGRGLERGRSLRPPRPQAPGAASGGRTSVWAGRSATPTGQVTPLGPWLQ